MSIETNLTEELQDALSKGNFRKLLEINSREPVALIPELQAGCRESIGSFMMPGIYTKFLHVICTPPELNAMYNQQYKFREKEAKEAYAAGNYDKYINMHEKPYRVEALFEVAGLMSDEALYPLFEQTWSGVENIWQNKHELEMMLRSKISKAPEPLRFDKNVELDFDQNGEVEIYRGYCLDEGDARGFSYSANLGRARWFSQRLSKSSAVRVLRVKKEDIVFTTDRRNEAEVVTLKTLTEEIEHI